MKPLKVALETLGCRVNIYDSEAMTEMFRADGYEVVEFNTEADVYVINTCTVTNMGDRKSRQLISRARRKNPDAVICVVGCYSQVAPEEIAALEGVDIVLGSRNKSRIVEFANRSRATGEQFIEVTDVLTSHEFEPLEVRDYQEHTRAFLKIQDGCNRFCSYCMIPYARGGISSKDRKQVLEEVHELVSHGFKEIILSGIHIASYGMDKASKEAGLLLGKDKGYDLLDLLEELETVDGLSRVRIGSIEPMFFQGERLGRISRLKKLCPHFHLSLQSGSDSVLKRMNRRYTASDYEGVVDALRREIPNVSITTDIIVGFPGETREEHQETVDFLNRIALTKTHIFKYSPRQGTPAASMANQVHGTIKEERSSELQSLSNRNEEAFHRGMVGQEHQVLVEQWDGQLAKGFTENFVEVEMKAGEDLSGKIISSRIVEAKTHSVIGEIK